MNQLMNFLQAASNTAASNVSGPVDLIAEALRAAGVPVPRNALLSSEWMREKGLTAPVQQGASQVAGDTLGLLAPVAAAAKAPQIARGLLQMGENAAAPRTIVGPSAKQRGVFVGDLSKTWDKSAAARAEAMERAGSDARTIWNETGTFRGVDGKWRQELDDSLSELKLPSKAAIDWLSEPGPATYPGGTARDLLARTQVFDAYPDAGDIKVMLQNGLGSDFGDSAHGQKIGLGVLFEGGGYKNANDSKAGLLHELQHAIQERQGFSGGGDPDSLSRLLRRSVAKNRSEAPKLLDLLAGGNASAKAVAAEKQAKKLGALADNIDARGRYYAKDIYRRLAGEAEARAVEARMNLTPAQRRALFPLDSYDVPANKLIVP